MYVILKFHNAIYWQVFWLSAHILDQDNLPLLRNKRQVFNVNIYFLHKPLSTTPIEFFADIVFQEMIITF